ncbi:MAG: membrane protein insertion efficiency factor YidD [Myxococcota bacterium]
MIAVLRMYQLVLSPFLGGACRYVPSCSEYAVAVIRREGVLRGLPRAVSRLLRCSPLGGRGLDLP